MSLRNVSADLPVRARPRIAGAVAGDRPARGQGAGFPVFREGGDRAAAFLTNGWRFGFGRKHRQVATFLGGILPHLHCQHRCSHGVAISGGDDLIRRVAEYIGERLTDQIRTGLLQRVGVLGKVGGRRLVDRHGAEVDVRGLDHANAGNIHAVEALAINQHGEGMVGHAGVGVHTAAIGGAAEVILRGDHAAGRR